MSDQRKTTDEEVTVPVAKDTINGLESLEELEAYAAEEAAAEDGREGVKEAYNKRKAELEAAAQEPAEDEAEEEEPEKVVLPTADLKELAVHVKNRVDADQKEQPRGVVNHIDQKLRSASETLQKWIREGEEEIEVLVDDIASVVNAIALKANRDSERRGMMQPSSEQKSIIEAKKKADSLEV